MSRHKVSTVSELINASEDTLTTEIEVIMDLDNVPALSLSPGQTLRGGIDHRHTLTFVSDSDGLQLTTDDSVCTLNLRASPHKRALWNDDSVPTLGIITIENVSAVGQVQILARNKVRAGHVEVHNLDVLARTLHRLRIALADMVLPSCKVHSHCGTCSPTKVFSSPQTCWVSPPAALLSRYSEEVSLSAVPEIREGALLSSNLRPRQSSVTE